MPGIVAKLSPRTSSAKKPRFLALLSNRLVTVRLIGAPANWLGIWAFRTAESPAFGLAPGFSPIDSGATWPVQTRSLKRRQPTSLDFTSGQPLNAAVFWVDEKSAIQALDRLDPVLPLSPGRAERHGFEYYRHGTLSLYAAHSIPGSGQVIGQTSARHTSAEFVAFLETLVARQPQQQSVLICDNLSAQKTKIFWLVTPKCVFITRPLTPPGSIKSKSGSPKSSETSSPAASSVRSKISIAKLCATSAPTIAKQHSLNGLTKTPPIVSKLL